MPRPQSFDRADVIEAIVNLFWERGFSATSISELQAASGLGRQSLYNSFGDKEALYNLALEAYWLRLQAELIDPLLANADVKTGFREVFDTAIAAATTDTLQRGCMLVNSATELSVLGESVREFVISAEKQIEDAFTQTIERGQQNGQIAKRQNPRKLALHLYNSLIGIRIRARYKPSRLNLQAIANAALQSLN